MKLALAMSLSNNRKVGMAAATYAARITCPSYCPLYHHGCYAGIGCCNLVTMRLDYAANQLNVTPLQVAKAEAKAIALLGVIPGLPLRGHVVGDCPTNSCAKIIGQAYRNYMERGGGQAYTYTHAYPNVTRKAWGEKISVLASLEGLSQLDQARKQGYLTAAVILQNVTKAFSFEGLRVIPCSYQTKGIQCSSCKLCFNEQKLIKQHAIIAFSPDNKISSHVCIE